MQKTPTDRVSLYPALTGSKTPSQDLKRNEKIDGDQLPVKVRLVRAGRMLVTQVLPQDVAFFTSVPLVQWGMQKTPTDRVSLYPALTGSKTPSQDLERNEKIDGDQLPVKVRLVQLTISGGCRKPPLIEFHFIAQTI